MQAINKTTRPNLLTQIEFFKNFYEHRKRVECTQQRSPLKKSMSYDQNKQVLHEYIKNRKEYTNLFNHKQTIKSNQMRDSKMLRNILDYDAKIFVFSLNKNPITRSTLHHNSIVTSNKKNESIDSENEKLHFRITKAKSLYSHLFPFKSLASSTRQFYEPKENPSSKRQNLFDNKVNTDVSNQEPELSQQIFTRSNRFQNDHLRNSVFQSRYQNSNLNEIKMNLLRSQFSQPSRKMCERVRREKLAQKLYEKKQKLQRGILSKLKVS